MFLFFYTPYWEYFLCGKSDLDAFIYTVLSPRPCIWARNSLSLNIYLEIEALNYFFPLLMLRFGSAYK